MSPAQIRTALLRACVSGLALCILLLGTACEQPAQPQPNKPQAASTPPAPAIEPEAPAPAPPAPAVPKPPLPEAKPPSVPPVSQPAEAAQMPKAKQPDEEARRLAEIARLLAERMPKRPTPSWVIFREAFEEDKDAACEADWTGENRLEVHTQNIKRLTLDLTKLPAGAPRKGPWNLQLDHQGIQITGLRGKVLDLVRSKNGNWAVAHSRDAEPQ